MHKLLSKPQVTVHENLTGQEPLLGWFPSTSCQVEETVKKLCAVSIRFPGAGENQDLYEELFDAYYDFSEHLITQCNEPCYFVKTESAVGIRSKLRSYKGVFPAKGSIKSGQYIEEEIDVKDNNTIILGMALITPLNGLDCMRLFGDFSSGFVLRSFVGENYSKAFLRLLADYLEGNDAVQWAYFDLVVAFCGQGNVIYRTFGDGGDDNITLQIFSPSIYRPQIENEIKAILDRPFQ